MTIRLDPPIIPKNGHTIEVIVPGRVSDPGPGKQDIRSLDDQLKLAKEWIELRSDSPIKITEVVGQGSGENLERQEFLDLISLVETGGYDLVLTEDLGRIVRRLQAHMFAELCVDQETRLISINDYVDTAVPGWQDRSIFAAWHHERSNRDTSDRIKRTRRSRFDQGGTCQLPIFGYLKPPGSKSDLDWTKDPVAEGIYREWFRKLDGADPNHLGACPDGALYSEIADWLNSMGTPTGPYCRQKKWDGPMVSRVTHNWLLKGVRFCNKRKSRRGGDGKYRSVKADPEELRTRRVPGLAFFEEAYYDRVVAKADARNSRYRRRGKNGRDPRRNVSRRRTRWPGQHLVCGICGRILVFGAHGQKDQLVCRGALNHECWNVVSCDSKRAATAIAGAVLEEIEVWPDYDAELIAKVREEMENHEAAQSQALAELRRREEKLMRQERNVRHSLREFGPTPLVQSEISALEQEMAELRAETAKLEQQQPPPAALPDLEELRQLARDQIRVLAMESIEFGHLMRQLLPQIECFPYESIDGGIPVLRASVRINLTGLLPDRIEADSYKELGSLSRSRLVDLFKSPQRIGLREKIMKQIDTQKQRDLAQSLGIKQAVISRAKKLTQRMEELGRSDPFVPIRQPIERGKKYRRQNHLRFCHTPLSGYEEPKFPAE